MRLENEKMTQASHEISRLTMEKDTIAQKNIELEQSLQTLKTENDELRPVAVAEPLLPPSYEEDVVNSGICISDGYLSINSAMSDMNIKAALSKDLSAVVVNALKRRQKHGLMTDLVIKSWSNLRLRTRTVVQ